MFTENIQGKKNVFAQQEADQAEQLQRIQDLLIASGYFRARLSISPFDKILGGMCWCITGSNIDVDIEFEDDLTMGQKVKLSEKVCVAVKEMECPYPIAAHQIQGLDYNKIYPVLEWLIRKLMENRDQRAAINRKQGVLNFSKFYPNKIYSQQSNMNDQKFELLKMKNIIFNGKPKRVFLTNRNVEEVNFQDPKRVHQCLREFNDLSANSVFQLMLEQISQLEKDQKYSGSTLGFTKIGGKQISQNEKSKFQTTPPSAQINSIGEDEEQTSEEIIKNVEKMLLQEKQVNLQTQGKGAAKLVVFNMNEGMMGNVQASKSQQQKVSQQISQDDAQKDETTGELDEDIHIIKRKTQAVKADNINDIFTENIGIIAESVNNFQKMEEEAIFNDPSHFYQKEKENYENEISKLKQKIYKQSQKNIEVQKNVQEITEDLLQLEYEKQQYQEQLDIQIKESEELNLRIEKSSVKEHEIMIVSTMIEEKTRLAEEKSQMKKKCKEEKKRLDQELEKMKKRREELEQEEHSKILGQIDREFDEEQGKLLQKRALVAVQNREIQIVQRKIENCPSNVELTQFHKRLVEIFENMNLKAEENRRYINLYNTVQETKKLFAQEKKYLNEINSAYRQSKQKKEREVLKNNIQATVEAISQNIKRSQKQVEMLREDSKKASISYNQNILAEKEHFLRLKEFEDQCDFNDELRLKEK